MAAGIYHKPASPLTSKLKMVLQWNIVKDSVYQITLATCTSCQFWYVKISCGLRIKIWDIGLLFVFTKICLIGLPFNPYTATCFFNICEWFEQEKH